MTMRGSNVHVQLAMVASNVTKKVTWQKNVQLRQTMLEVVVVQEVQVVINVAKKVILLVNAKIHQQTVAQTVEIVTIASNQVTWHVIVLRKMSMKIVVATNGNAEMIMPLTKIKRATVAIRTLKSKQVAGKITDQAVDGATESIGLDN